MKIQNVEHVLSVADRQQLPDLRGEQIAFVGRSNVGKSSLLNRLVGQRGVARTSSTPGHTRLVQVYRTGGGLYLVDLPGYGYARRSQSERRDWASLIQEYFESLGDDAIAVHVVDAKVGATDLDREAADYLAQLGVPAVVAATKLDRVKRSGRHAALREVREGLALTEDREPVGVSSRTGEGIKDLWKELTRRLDVAA